MKERSILFTKENRQKAIDGTKTQTRRVIVPQPAWEVEHFSIRFDVESQANRGIWRGYISKGKYKGWCKTPTWKPRYQVGDRLYIKEPINVGCGGKFLNCTQFRYIENPEEKCRTIQIGYGYSHSYRDASRMPKYAARYWFEVTAIRVERVRDISKEDCLKEGLKKPKRNRNINITHWSESDASELTLQKDFMFLWDSINKKRGYGWDKNPWVWVVEFKRIEKGSPQDSIGGEHDH